MTKRKLILDTETTGLDVEKGDRIVEIGIIELQDDIKTGSGFHSYINPERNVSIEAKRIHKLDETFLKDKPKFAEIIDDLNNYIKDSVLVIHNAVFDKKFLDFEYENCGYKPLQNQIIDTINIARKEFPGQSVSLDSLCRKLKVDNSNRKIHGAFKDSDLLTSVYLKLTTGKQNSFYLENKYSEKDLNLNRNNLNIKNTQNQKYTDRSSHFPILKEELEEHRRFIKKIKNSVWEILNN